MKTKIIYISGNEVFEMADIRAAFEEVRATLNLGVDTVLFGVPVDADDALAQNTTMEIAPAPASITPNIEIVTTDTDNNNAPETIDATTTTDAEEIKAPVKKKKTSTRRTSGGATNTPENEATPVDLNETAKSDTVVPILSVLAAQTAVAQSDDDTQPINTDAADISVNTAGAITEMITDEAPEVTREKTLEELLESMTPLREDTHEDAPAAIIDEASTPTEIEIDGADATLEQLASEFAQNEDKIVTSTKNETHGKIGKLKNILPFKKAKRDDAGIMGDLFGWAGIAANDEDFAIPGFFTTTAAKK